LVGGATSLIVGGTSHSTVIVGISISHMTNSRRY